MARAKHQQLAAVRIGYHTVLVDAAKAGRIVELLADAVECAETFPASGTTYKIKGPLELEYRLVRPGQVIAPEPPPAPSRVRALLPAPGKSFIGDD